jgi:flagellar FliJ protein
VGFKFRYEALLSYRENVKEKAEVELWKAQTELNRTRELLRNYEESQQEGIKSLERNLMTRMPSEEVTIYSDYLSGLREKIVREKEDVVKWEKVVNKKREDLLAKAKEYRVIEKLKEKDFLKWNHLQLQIEQKKMNEVAVTRHGKEFL